DPTRTTYIFDVRDPAEYVAGRYPNALSAPTGQLAHTTDIYSGTLGARIVLSSYMDARALMTSSWLMASGWKDVFILRSAADDIGEPSHKLLREPPTNESIDPAQLSSLLDQKSATVVDLSTSPHYRRGHIPSAWFAIRGRLNLAIEKIDVAGT